MSTKPNRVLSIALLLNPDAAYYSKCSHETRRAIRNIAGILLFSATICGFILASSIIRFGFGGNYRYWWIVFPACALFYFLLDKAIVFTNPKTNRSGLATMRITIALVLGLTNSELINTYYYSDDISAAQQQEVTKIEAGINAGHDRAQAVIMEKRQPFIHRIDSIKAQLSSKRTALNDEADGHGGSGTAGVKGIWASKYLTYRDDSVSAESEIAMLANEMRLLDSDLKQNDSLQKARIAGIPATLNVGINRNMELLHRIIWTQGNFTNKFMCILILLFSLLLELLPLIAKSRYDISKYFERADQDSQHQDDIAAIQSTIQKRLASERGVAQLKLEVLAVRLATLLKELDDKIYFQGQVWERQINAIRDHDAAARKYARDYQEYYDSHIKPTLEKLLTDLNDAVNSALNG